MLIWRIKLMEDKEILEERIICCTKKINHKIHCIQNFYIDGDFNILFPGCEVFLRKYTMIQNFPETGSVWYCLEVYII